MTVGEAAPAGEAPPPAAKTPQPATEASPPTAKTPPPAGETPPPATEAPPPAAETPPPTAEAPATEAPPPATEAPPPTAKKPPPATEAPPPAAEKPLAAPRAAVAPVQAPEPAGRSAYDALWDTGLLNVLTLARGGLAALFLSPVAYVVGVLVIVPTSLFGYGPQVNSGMPFTMAGVFNWVALAMVFLTPLATMRLLAGERRSGTLEQLLTSPVRCWELVVGRWLAGLLLFLAAIAFTLVYVVLVSLHQREVDYGAIVTGYIGAILVGAAWVALGLLASSLTPNRVAAAIAGIAILLAFQYLFGALSVFLSAPLSDLFEYVSAANRAQSFDNGQLVLRDAVYFLTVTAGALFLATQALASRRWRR
jgi:ABC-2 type transport system permease protein